MIHLEGENYHFFFCNPDSVARVQSKISPFYDHPLSSIEELPYLYSQPSLVPKFLYEIEYDRRSYPSSPMKTPSYMKYENGLLSSEDSKFGAECYELAQGNTYPIKTNPYRILGSPPIFVTRDGVRTQIGISKPGNFSLSRLIRKRMFSTRYLSLRDIVNPELDEDSVIRKIEELYFDKESKTFLFRLVKILYAGTPAAEQELVSNLFTYEIEFAKFLRDRIFSIEILPLIHGPFLNSILNKLDERILKYSIPNLSPPVRKMVEKNVSKNRWKQILDGPSKKPELGESFPEIVEKEIFKRFSRRIYYEEGNFSVYQESVDPEQLEIGARATIEFQAIAGDRYNLNSNREGILLYSVTKEKILFQIQTYMEIVRFDLFLSKKERDSLEFFRIPSGSILEIPRYDQTKMIVGAAISNEKKPLEFSLLSFDY
ncbi:hypothetical protein EHQ53_02735 [Leptospira langatensis]|uniref:Flagellar motor switch protein FliG n=1 Tax=Leptospira langatensis TaxID=2484983 RepID=A0A5F1ZXA8_9LEPT|nr:hypothetical protein [Leptospira langatensis]TGK04081.1 hypothetical protein EHO57_02965 [Leptospira langatensis]TGL43561.1 hypothetical protein EHQ53_02735 [Leptospira langatensis]